MKEDLTNTDFNTEEYYLNNIGIYNYNSEEWTYYVNGLVREAKIEPTSSQTPEHIAEYFSYTPQEAQVFDIDYYITDYLGNTRIVYKPDLRCVNSTATLQTQNVFMADYYPYGKILRQFEANNGEVERYLTTQHERDNETGLDYRGARFYDSDVGRFLSLDPLAADYPTLSDYSYVAGNPIMYTDPTGMAVETTYEDETTGEQVTIDDGIDKTLKVNSTDFNKAKDFADRIYETENDTDGDGLVPILTQSLEDEYVEFYNGVNYYEELSFESVYDYLFVSPELDVVSTVLGGSGSIEYLGGPVNKGIKATGWIASKVYKSLTPAIQKKVVTAMSKGVVSPTGRQGIIKLTATEAKATGYTHKIKILGKGGDLRIYGKQGENGHIVFDKVMVH